MDPVVALERLGGHASARQLLRLTTRRRLRKAVERGRLLQPARGRYMVPTAAEARIAGARLTAVVCLRSAAALHGWELKVQPTSPELMVRRGRKLTAEQRDGVVVRWANLAADQVRDGVTTPLRTVLDCARALPFDEALAIADSALRSGLVTREDLDGIDVRGAGAAAVRRVLVHADARAANPFESVLRALCIEAGLAVEPQAHRRDCARYNLLVVRGWRVLRFTWEQVMHDQAYVRWVLAEVVRPVGRPEAGHALAQSA
ncbi:hypothetical protein GCM10011376_28810 [Nocardioides flavus (ex Wang et al. 2016)]|uniref:Transcriptional regulator, AbiEi antitoxin, Type IV TA system n=1 Tax=Nocardioides flavus (ex Wang et al. 2016) TaxID=2058780 RepID=A0ABQ3HNF5_9ACTN|nr:hypothetical protein [Nocardioides flavus (ex Wang et al. 2016)]GHE18271.1 hypothetical protein GCM10011376_28810 [Nocardioides flavus (ex Wang et al. 2016)]